MHVYILHKKNKKQKNRTKYIHILFYRQTIFLFLVNLYLSQKIKYLYKLTLAATNNIVKKVRPVY